MLGILLVTIFSTVFWGYVFYKTISDKDKTITKSRCYLLALVGSLMGLFLSIGVGYVYLNISGDLSNQTQAGYVNTKVCVEFSEVYEDRFGNQSGGCLAYEPRAVPVIEYLEEKLTNYAILGTVFGPLVIGSVGLGSYYSE